MIEPKLGDVFRLCANTDPQRDSLFTKGSPDVLNYATSEIVSGRKLGIDATKKIPSEGEKVFRRSRLHPRRWPRTIPLG